QDDYVRKVIDTLNDLPSVLWEICEEPPPAIQWWQGHMISLVHSYEQGKPLQHPVGYNSGVNSPEAEWVAPNQNAHISPANNGGQVLLNDSDHTYFGMWNDSVQTNRNYVWENFTNGSGVLFMDPYEISWPSRN